MPGTEKGWRSNSRITNNVIQSISTDTSNTIIFNKGLYTLFIHINDTHIALVLHIGSISDEKEEGTGYSNRI